MQATIEKPKTKIPQRLLNKLRIGKPGILPVKALVEVAKIAEIIPEEWDSFKSFYADDYRNEAINFLDANYPGWRGYTVSYVSPDFGLNGVG